MTLYQDKYRIESARLPWWNYASEGSYFLTICTHRSECFLGQILNGNMRMSDFGLIVQEELLRSFEIRHELKCISYMIMPNHLHIIVNLTQIEKLIPIKPGLSTLQSKSVSSFVGGFKASATSRINTLRNTTGQKVWHPRFYDHLIRSNAEFEFIYNYIAHNPATWLQDRFNRRRISNELANYPEN